MKDSLVDFDSKPEGKPVLCEAETDDEGAAPEEIADDAREDLSDGRRAWQCLL